MSVSAEMPKYQSHKTVHALKIKRIYKGPDGRFYFQPTDERYSDIVLDSQYMIKHDPQSGGYYVVYDDGYKSSSPAEAFEGGYSLVD